MAVSFVMFFCFVLFAFFSVNILKILEEASSHQKSSRMTGKKSVTSTEMKARKIQSDLAKKTRLYDWYSADWEYGGAVGVWPEEHLMGG